MADWQSRWREVCFDCKKSILELNKQAIVSQSIDLSFHKCIDKGGCSIAAKLDMMKT